MQGNPKPIHRHASSSNDFIFQQILQLIKGKNCKRSGLDCISLPGITRAGSTGIISAITGTPNAMQRYSIHEKDVLHLFRGIVFVEAHEHDFALCIF